jgi:hypothetical protein
MFSVTLCLTCLLYVMHCRLHFHLASHLGTLDAPREGCDARAKPEDGVWWIYPEDGMTK